MVVIRLVIRNGAEQKTTLKEWAEDAQTNVISPSQARVKGKGSVNDVGCTNDSPPP
jgi:hypothetical protein